MGSFSPDGFNFIILVPRQACMLVLASRKTSFYNGKIHFKIQGCLSQRDLKYRRTSGNTVIVAAVITEVVVKETTLVCAVGWVKC